MDHAKKINVRLKENSFLAGVASFCLRQPGMAVVLGRTIHLHGVSEIGFLADKRWVYHELTHVAQFQQHGTFIFLWKYVWESLRKGYWNNRYEIEARLAEEKTAPLIDVEMISNL